MARGKFQEYLKNNVVLFDGAMGTELYNRGVYLNRCFDELNLSRPQIVRDVHRSYVQAGADVIETNTFGANAFKLCAHGIGEKVEAINREGAKIARAEAGEECWVAGSIGPLGIRIEPWGATSEKEAQKAFEQQAKALLEGGVDLFILETFSDLNEIHQAIKAVREIGSLPVMAMMTLNDDGTTPYGNSPEQIVAHLSEWGADIIGLNCGVGPQIMLNALEKMVRLTTKPLAVMPNAGFPRNVEGRSIYLASAEYMAEYARRFIQTGAKIIGGCCGTTPEYIKAMHSAICSLRPNQTQIAVKIQERSKVWNQPCPMPEKSELAAKISAGKFITTVELVPPRGTDFQKAVNTARTLKENQVDSINIPEGPRALARMGAPFLGKVIMDTVGIEPIVHYTCRDRNLLGIISDLLGIHAVGLRNLLLITGDPPKMGDMPNATAVFDIDSIGLVNVVNYLNHGVDLGGNPIEEVTRYLIGVGVNPGAIDLDLEMRRFEWKVKAGAEFAITQPVFDVEIFENFMHRFQAFKIPLIAGIWPLVSLRNAEFMNNEVPGAHVPPEIMEKMRRAKTREVAIETGLQIAVDTIKKIKPLVNGVQISMPFGNVEYPLKVLSAIQTS
ncbi:MAG TPA: bifunctional homocysteine S-methyltransferase/methylenetetrahydrofolate reductase [Candidatus Marinimicrobia bacterium]|nr:bifunctional homocysteine S-methyltransferase/methylenetetrahydrofolate reductase [Candidatus Neomarinimicrobiota bacterium]HRS51414.1 bifunctional homocysteine S-methyltransferase/methylenetetrahydrofolate reductase [Candidatus Neomarinimicrobiota bacterium]HRU92214.1 bifunctional homocysteine S-methyltransferase/methylenetetrahydrofolate reductase [Candidatus Neomarinimicrobiota bacterium]